MKPDLRKAHKYRGCLIEPETGPPIDFGVSKRNYSQTHWWRITFPNNTWTRVANMKVARRYIRSEEGREQGDLP